MEREYHDKRKFLYIGKECFLHELIDISELKEEELKKTLGSSISLVVRRLYKNR